MALNYRYRASCWITSSSTRQASAIWSARSPTLSQTMTSCDHRSRAIARARVRLGAASGGGRVGPHPDAGPAGGTRA
jgi:hypothetical protein